MLTVSALPSCRCTGRRVVVTRSRYNRAKIAAAQTRLEENRYYLVMGRMGAGQEVVDLELFINSQTPVDRKQVPVNPKANPSKMAVGQERDATNHPGKESFHGEIARFLIFERPLSDEELSQMIKNLCQRYQIKKND